MSRFTLFHLGNKCLGDVEQGLQALDFLLEAVRAPIVIHTALDSHGADGVGGLNQRGFFLFVSQLCNGLLVRQNILWRPAVLSLHLAVRREALDGAAGELDVGGTLRGHLDDRAGQDAVPGLYVNRFSDFVIHIRSLTVSSITLPQDVASSQGNYERVLPLG